MPKKKSKTSKKVRSKKRSAKPKNSQKKHPWRSCPVGHHYRSGSSVSGYTTRTGKAVGAHSRDWTCVRNPSGRDQLYPEEIQKIARDHFLNLTEEDMLDPNLSICAGVRWLFRKREIATAKLRRPATWRETLIHYKGLDLKTKRDRDLLQRFDDDYASIKEP